MLSDVMETAAQNDKNQTPAVTNGKRSFKWPLFHEKWCH